LGKEKALEKLETVAVGRALAFMGIGIVDGLASADEMDRFNCTQAKNEPPKTDETLEKLGFCTVCGEQGIKAKRKTETKVDIEKIKADVSKITDIKELRKYYKKNKGLGKEVSELITKRSDEIKNDIPVIKTNGK
jgi:hypothetical protein